MTPTYDDAVAGAGIIGLAHAYHLARRGRRVIVFDRSTRAEGASVRNFGMIWPIGQPDGPLRRLALRSRSIWLEVLASAGLWHDASGSLHVAYQDDEERVLDEFLARERSAGTSFGSGLLALDAAGVVETSPLVCDRGLRGGLLSPWEVGVDPREVVAGLPGWLERELGVTFAFGRGVVGYDGASVATPAGGVGAGRLWVCSGDDLRSLYPETLGALGLVRCKLQMLRTQPLGDGRRLGPMLAGGLTLRHYGSFAGCPSLPGLKERVARESPEYDRYGIHVMAAQNGRGELVLGDSHEYGEAIEPFDKEVIDALILARLATMLKADLAGRLAARWHGVYAKHPEKPYCVVQPAERVTAVTGLGGAGMTLSFGLAAQVVGQVLGEG